MLSRCFSAICFVLISCVLFGQKAPDPVLFSIDDNPVYVSEFEYIYKKTNGKNADFSKASLEEYLDLYTKFKLKVNKARGMQLDTIPALQKELDGYRNQLADSYLMDRNVTERLVEEVYERVKTDVKVRHIMIGFDKNDPDTTQAYKAIMAIKKKLDDGQDFIAVAKSDSQDPMAKKNGGDLGYITGLQLPGFYSIESAAYSTPEGAYSGPVKSSLGYHIIYVEDVRPARGKIEAAHILVRIKKGESPDVSKTKIDEAYAKLKAGESFESLAKTYSDDKASASKGGSLGVFGISKYEASFENAAFGLQNDGDFSEPFQTSVGWHIIKRDRKIDIKTYKEEKSGLTARVKRDPRFEIAKKSMIQGIKERSSYKENKNELDRFVKTLDKTFLSRQWKPASFKKDVELFSLGSISGSLSQFVDYLKKNPNDRSKYGKGSKFEESAYAMFEDFVNEKAIEYEKGQLSNKYPEFKSLMREYEEGILLFEATKMLVWDKASEDTTGLKTFYENNKGQFMWDERAEIDLYSLKTTNEKVSKKAYKLASKKSSEKALSVINKGGELLTVTTMTIEKSRLKPDMGLAWKKGSVSPKKINGDVISFSKVRAIVPSAQKTLMESRGYVVAGYQDYLEKQWVDSLKKEYKVEINENAFKSLIK